MRLHTHGSGTIAGSAKKAPHVSSMSYSSENLLLKIQSRKLCNAKYMIPST